MKRMTKVLAFFLVLTMMFTMVACNNTPGSTTSKPSGSQPNNGTTANYTVTITTVGGMPMKDVDVYVYADNTLADLVQAGKTDKDGKATLTMNLSEKYAIVLSGVPAGYATKEYYTFSGSSALIVLESSLISGEDVNGHNFKLGDVMYDFEVTTPEGETIKLSEVLAEKKAVMLNFWYSTCSWCVTEFPVLNECYQNYSDKLEIIALNPYPTDTNSHVTDMKESMGLSFPMAKCGNNFNPANFGGNGYPVSVFIDRYGVICLIEVGAVTDETLLDRVFAHFTADAYEQKVVSGVNKLIPVIKPDVEMPSSDEIEGVINQGDINATYRPETNDDAEYAWPFVIKEFMGENVLATSNKEINNSFSIIYVDVELKAGQALLLDYFASTQQADDFMLVTVDGNAITQISGLSSQWETCCPWVALKDGVYEIGLCYVKDGSNSENDDTIYIKNMRIAKAEDIEKDILIPRQAAVRQEDGSFEYIEYVFNSKDGYYHVGSEDGPLLLCNIMGYTQFNDSDFLYNMAYSGKLVLNGYDYVNDLTPYANYANNSALRYYCTVNQGLFEILQAVDQILGFDDEDPNEWLLLCTYYQPYGPNGSQLEDPIKGQATFSAPEAVLGVGVESNQFYYDRPIMPRGLLFKFVPEVSGVYRITSHTDYEFGVDAWIFNEKHELIYSYNGGERDNTDPLNVSMQYYMEAGVPYFLSIAFWDMYEFGYIPFDLEYMGESYKVFTVASPGTFTYIEGSNAIIAGGIDVALGEDGVYHHVLGKDENGNPILGSKLYADFTYRTNIFEQPIADTTIVDPETGDKHVLYGLISKGGFDFSKSELDLQILTFLEKHDGDKEATREFLKDYWGKDYDANYASYQVDEVFEGIYHGKGEDMTELAKTYLAKIITGSGDEAGCVEVTEELGTLLQALMDKYTFEGVDHSWTKLCYYFQVLGPAK